MEFAKTEMTLVEVASQEGIQNDVRELSELQLALVGGGIGDVIFA